MPISTPQPIVGSGGRILFAGVNNQFSDNFYANLDDYSIDPTGDLEEVTNFESPQVSALQSQAQYGPVHKESIIGCTLMCTVSFKGFWDAANQPQNLPFNMQSLAIIYNIYVYTNKNLNPYIFKRVNCNRTSIKGNAKKGRVEFDFSGECTGQWFYPSS